MKKEINLTEEQIEALEIYIELELTKFGKTKKDKYAEVQRRTKRNIHTITSWISRHLKKYKEIRAELEEERNAKILNYQRLTKKSEKYIYYRYSGLGREEAKLKAGYSPKTKVANIERNPKVANSMAELREICFQDIRYGALANLNALVEIRNKGIAGVETTEYTDESNPDGRVISKTVKKEKQLGASVSAAKEINSMLGYKVVDEAKSKQLALLSREDDIVVSDEDFE